MAGEPGDGVPLLGLHRRGEEPILAEADLAEQIAMQGYAGSVAFAADGGAVGITSPRGGRLHVFDNKVLSSPAIAAPMSAGWHRAGAALWLRMGWAVSCRCKRPRCRG